MAERNQRKFADAPDFHPNDPFAELTRIMGFDPRVASLGAQKAASAAAAANSDDDPFDLDLEKELMGAFEESEPEVEPEMQAAPVARFQPVVAAPMVERDEILLDDDFDIAPDDSEMTAEVEQAIEVPASQAAVAPALSLEDELEMLLSGATLAAPATRFMAPAQVVEAETLVAFGVDDAVADEEPTAYASPEDTLAEAISEPETGYLAEDPAEAFADESSDFELADFGIETDEPAVETDQVLAAPALQLRDEPAEALIDRPDDAELDDFVLPAIETVDEAEQAWASAPEPEAYAEPIEYAAVAPLDEQADAPVSEQMEGAAEPTRDHDDDDPFAALAALAAAPAALSVHRPRMSLATPVAPRPDARASDYGSYASYRDPAPRAAEQALSPVVSEAPAWTPAPAFAEPAARAVPFDEWKASTVPAAPVAETYEPDGDIVDMPKESIAVSDDLDIPDLDLADAAIPASSDYDDLDLDLGPGLDEIRIEEPAQYRAAPQDEHTLDELIDAVEEDFARDLAENEPTSAPAPAYAQDLRPLDRWAAPAAAAAAASSMRGYSDQSPRQAPQQPAVAAYDDSTDEHFDFDDDTDQQHYYPAVAKSGRGGKGLWIAGLIAGVAALGAIGAYAVSFGIGDDSSAPTIVRADPSPVKVKPENPGGASVPNQNNPVYDRVAGAAPTASPTQEKLLSGAEEPVDMPVAAAAPVAAAPDMVAPEDELPTMGGDDQMATEMAEGESETLDALPGVQLPQAVDTSETVGTTTAAAVPSAKNEDRIAAAIAADATGGSVEEVVAVAPRKVKTMVVRPDGTMAPREEPEVVAAKPEQPAEAAVLQEPVAKPAPVAAVPAAKPVATVAAAPAAPAVKPAVATPAAATPAAVAKAKPTPAAMPKSMPVAPSRPSDQPVEIVGGVTEQKVASIEPQAAPAASGGWTMQIASQPTADGAQASYQDLARRFGSVIGGKGVNIVKAEIAGKGTFYRVRVPAGSRNDAISLCEKYKGAGGSCFVSR